MTKEKKVTAEGLEKALADLRGLVKGHDSRGTNSTKVESMSGEGGATQVHHTPGNSDPGGWAGSRGESVSENGASDSVSSNGTDYAAGMRKSIRNKLNKGLPLTAEEVQFVTKGGFPFGKDKDDDKEDKKDEAKKANATTVEVAKANATAIEVAKAKDADDDEEETKKSLADVAAEIPSVQRGLEVSEFLAGFADAVSKSLSLMEERMTARLASVVTADTATAGEFQKSLADAVCNLGEAIALQAQRIEQVETAPARGPKGQVVPMEKSFGGAPAGEQLSKSQIQIGMEELVRKGSLSALEVVKYESTGEISDSTYARVKTALRS